MLYEEWRGEYLGDKKIGYSYTILESLPAVSDVPSATRYRLIAFIAIPSQSIICRAVAETGPDFSIRLLRVESEAQGSRTEAEGSLVGNNLVVRVLSSGAVSERTVPAEERIYLADAVPWLIARRDPEPGATASFPVLDPTMLAKGIMTTEVIGWEDWAVQGETVRALRVKATYFGIPVDLWMGPKGELYESRTAVMNSRSVRESRESLEQSGDFADLDHEELILSASIPSNVHLRRPDHLTSLTVEISDLPEGVTIPQDSWQQVVAEEAEAVRLKIGSSAAPAPEPTAGIDLEPFLRPSLLVQSDDSRIRARAREIVGEATEASANARRIAEWISREMKSELRVTTPSAAEILESMRGDCNEHATLFAALCRAVEIPTKICAGIVYQDGRFFYHAWNEIFDSDTGWVPVDTAFRQFPADPTHIKLAEGDLEEHVLIARLVGKIQVEILSTEPPEP